MSESPFETRAVAAGRGGSGAVAGRAMLVVPLEGLWELHDKEWDDASEFDCNDSYWPDDARTIARWQDRTFEGKTIPRGNWYDILANDNLTSYGLIDVGNGECIAFRPYMVGVSAGRVFYTFDEAIHYLARLAEEE